MNATILIFVTVSSIVLILRHLLQHPNKKIVLSLEPVYTFDSTTNSSQYLEFGQNTETYTDDDLREKIKQGLAMLPGFKKKILEAVEIYIVANPQESMFSEFTKFTLDIKNLLMKRGEFDTKFFILIPEEKTREDEEIQKFVHDLGIKQENIKIKSEFQKIFFIDQL